MIVDTYKKKSRLEFHFPLRPFLPFVQKVKKQFYDSELECIHASPYNGDVATGTGDRLTTPWPNAPAPFRNVRDHDRNIPLAIKRTHVSVQHMQN